MNLPQLSIFLENKPGRLQSVLKVLADKKINILTLTIAEVNDFGIVRMIVTNASEAAAALKAEHITCSLTDVLAIEIADQPGALYEALETFAKHNLNIEYMYAFTEKRKDKAVMIFRFENIEAAKSALKDGHFTIIHSKDILGD